MTAHKISIPKPNAIRAKAKARLSEMQPLICSDAEKLYPPHTSKNPEAKGFASAKVRQSDNPHKYNGGYLYNRRAVEEGNDARNPTDSPKFKIQNIRVQVPRRATINVDYFQIFGRCEKIPDLVEGQEVYSISENVRLIWKGHGTSLFNALYDVYLQGEKIGQIQAFPRSTKQQMQQDHIIFKLDNHILYTKYWLDTFLDFLNESESKVLNVSRLDIAIDGVEQINDFLNHYFKTPKGIYEQISIKNGGKIKHHPLDYDPNTKKSTRFVFGSTKSDKHVAVYQKSKEIEQSNKKYIERFWENSGMEFKEGEEITRVEMRLNSKSTKQIQGFDWTRLHCSKYLASIFKTQAHNFFDFYIKDNSNVSRCTGIRLIDYEMLGAELLEKIQKKEVNDRYKAKLTLHLIYKLWYTGKLDEQALDNDFVNDLLFRFDLGEWLNNKIEDWVRLYQRNPPETDLGNAGEQPNRDRGARVEVLAGMPP